MQEGQEENFQYPNLQSNGINGGKIVNVNEYKASRSKVRYK